jgi:hypothetical protein
VLGASRATLDDDIDAGTVSQASGPVVDVAFCSIRSVKGSTALGLAYPGFTAASGRAVGSFAWPLGWAIGALGSGGAAAAIARACCGWGAVVFESDV